MNVRITAVDWFLDRDTREGTVTFSVGGTLLDAFSHLTDYQAGEIASVTIDHLCGETSWEERFGRNPEKRKSLVKTGDWSYEAFGEIVGVDPVVADFGPFTLDLGYWSHDKRLIGEFIFWRISRLDILRQSAKTKNTHRDREPVGSKYSADL